MEPLKIYENYSKSNHHIYNNINELVYNNDIKFKNNIVIYLLNWPCGFGSALTVFMQNMYYLLYYNKDLIVLPHFSKNSSNFKYHEEQLNNSFFLYYKYKYDINLNDKVIYFSKTIPLETPHPFFSYCIPLNINDYNMKYINCFNNNFSICFPNNNIYDYLKLIKSKELPLIGIHIRSYAQKRCHLDEYTNIDIQTRLIDVKDKIECKYGKKYQMFIASDVESYINLSKNIFQNINCLNINRVNTGFIDSIPHLKIKPGYILGNEILSDCYILAHCDETYVSASNIVYIISTINTDCKLIDY